MLNMNEFEAQERLLTVDHAAALAAEAAAVKALEDAQLRALTGGVPVPGSLVDAAAAAKKVRTDLDGALAAYARGVELGEQAATETARASREAEVQAAVADFQKHAAEVIAIVGKLMTTGDGAKACAALGQVLKAVGNADSNVLTAGGWLTSDGLRAIRATPAQFIVAGMINRVLDDGSHGARRAETALQTLCAGIVAGVKAQPSTWPGA